jgi:two-component system OmpR family sensor kinase
VASIVAVHEGSIAVDETPGGGATFRVSLPANGPTNSPEVLGL